MAEEWKRTVETIPTLTKNKSNGTPMQVVEGLTLCEAVAQIENYASWRSWTCNKFNFVEGVDFVKGYRTRNDGTRLPGITYFFSIPAAQKIAMYYANRATQEKSHPVFNGTEAKEDEELDDLLEILAEIAEHYGVRDPLQSASVAAELITGKDCFKHLDLNDGTAYNATELGAFYGLSAVNINKKLVELGFHIQEKKSWGILYKTVHFWSHLSAGMRNDVPVWNARILPYLDSKFGRRTVIPETPIDEKLKLFQRLKAWIPRIFQKH